MLKRKVKLDAGVAVDDQRVPAVGARDIDKAIARAAHGRLSTFIYVSFFVALSETFLTFRSHRLKGVHDGPLSKQGT